MAYQIKHDVCEALLDSTQDEALFKVPQDKREGLLAAPKDSDEFDVGDCESLFASSSDCDSLLHFVEEDIELVSKVVINTIN